jgi:hypothetical protein
MNREASGDRKCLTVGASVRVMVREYMIAAEFGIKEYYVEDIRLTEEVVGWKVLQEMVDVPGL